MAVFIDLPITELLTQELSSFHQRVIAIKLICNNAGLIPDQITFANVKTEPSTLTQAFHNISDSLNAQTNFAQSALSFEQSRREISFDDQDDYALVAALKILSGSFPEREYYPFAIYTEGGGIDLATINAHIEKPLIFLEFLSNVSGVDSETTKALGIADRFKSSFLVNLRTDLLHMFATRFIMGEEQFQHQLASYEAASPILETIIPSQEDMLFFFASVCDIFGKDSKDPVEQMGLFSAIQTILSERDKTNPHLAHIKEQLDPLRIHIERVSNLVAEYNGKLEDFFTIDLLNQLYEDLFQL